MSYGVGFQGDTELWPRYCLIKAVSVGLMRQVALQAIYYTPSEGNNIEPQSGKAELRFAPSYRLDIV